MKLVIPRLPFDVTGIPFTSKECQNSSVITSDLQVVRNVGGIGGAASGVC